MKKNSPLKIIFTIVGAVVVLGTIAAAVVHFWEDIKKLIPCKKDEEEFDDFDDLAE